MHWCTLAIPLFYSYLALHSFYHSGPGENMASGFQLWSEVMWAFYEEYKSYSYSNPAYSAATGHFTQ
eukprot:scaffold29773_cov22-Tisochrysis_lutea.AAC.3